MNDRHTAGSISASTGLRQVMQRHPLLFFFLIAYAFSWIMVIPYILAEWGILQGNFTLIFVIKSFGPFVAAFIMTQVTEGKAGVQRLRHSLRQWRVGWQWYLFILVAIPALVLPGLLLLPGALASFQGFPPNFAITYLVTFVLIFFGGGPLGEEPGWRGFALPRLQTRYGPLWGTLLLGIMWVFWHLPDFLTDAQRGGPGADVTTLLTVNLPIFFLMVMGLAIVFTWVFNQTGGSVFIAILLHTSFNAAGLVQPLFAAPSVINTDLFMCIGVVALALLIVILTRGRLGYRQ